MDVAAEMREAAQQGVNALKQAWDNLTAAEKRLIKPSMERLKKEAADSETANLTT
jgi:hypothetical protein